MFTMNNDEAQPLYRPTIPSLDAYAMRYSTTPNSFLAARLRRAKELRRLRRERIERTTQHDTE